MGAPIRSDRRAFLQRLSVVAAASLGLAPVPPPRLDPADWPDQQYFTGYGFLWRAYVAQKGHIAVAYRDDLDDEKVWYRSQYSLVDKPFDQSVRYLTKQITMIARSKFVGGHLDGPEIPVEIQPSPRWLIAHWRASRKKLAD